MDELTNSYEVYLLTPSRFNPHGPSYAINENTLTDWEGDVVRKLKKQRIMLLEVEELGDVSAVTVTDDKETVHINYLLEQLDDDSTIHPEAFEGVPPKADEIALVLVGVSPVLNDANLY